MGLQACHSAPVAPLRVASLNVVPETTVELELAPLDPGSNPNLNGWRAPVRAEARSEGTFEVLGALPDGRHLEYDRTRCVSRRVHRGEVNACYCEFLAISQSADILRLCAGEFAAG
jgi:hypothetical protein